MPHPVIILGAGASLDYIRAEDRTRNEIFKPPLTDELCKPQNFTSVATNRSYLEAERLAADLRTTVPHRKSLEIRLGEIRDRAAQDHERQKQLISFEFFLQDLFQKISDGYGGQPGNNYEALINHINDYINDHGGNATILTFNYDTFLERHLGIGNELISYTQSRIKLIKLHGSCDWVYVLADTHFATVAIQDSYAYLMKDPYYLTRQSKRTTEPYPYRKRAYQEVIEQNRIFYYCPAIAIPLPDKDSHLCPEEHTAEMKKALAATDRILIIGWKGGDPNLINLLQQTIKQPVSVTIVVPSLKTAQEIKDKLRSITSLNFTLKESTFTEFMRSGDCDTFFTLPEP